MKQMALGSLYEEDKVAVCSRVCSLLWRNCIRLKVIWQCQLNGKEVFASRLRLVVLVTTSVERYWSWASASPPIRRSHSRKTGEP